MSNFEEKGLIGPVGPPGAPGFTGPYKIDQAVLFAERKFCVSRERILIGFKNTPPDTKEFDVYIFMKSVSAEYFIKKNDKWINWCWEES